MAFKVTAEGTVHSLRLVEGVRLEVADGILTLQDAMGRTFYVMRNVQRLETQDA